MATLWLRFRCPCLLQMEASHGAAAAIAPVVDSEQRRQQQPVERQAEPDEPAEHVRQVLVVLDGLDRNLVGEHTRPEKTSR